MIWRGAITCDACQAFYRYFANQFNFSNQFNNTRARMLHVMDSHSVSECYLFVGIKIWCFTLVKCLYVILKYTPQNN